MVTTGRTSLKDDIKLLYQPAHLIVGTPGQSSRFQPFSIINLFQMLIMLDLNAS
ncbi:DEAD-box ATP-dependent RNA helicase 8 [Platanthera guangdongensis]|uniref:DEAD-box ATP-dependent RNA helicase 8 n=1 Tax=Platanthera guangdongensis TaxID=2320717 RepID=A0ABR2MHJ6_9ASPA